MGRHLPTNKLPIFVIIIPFIDINKSARIIDINNSNILISKIELLI